MDVTNDSAEASRQWLPSRTAPTRYCWVMTALCDPDFPSNYHRAECIARAVEDVANPLSVLVSMTVETKTIMVPIGAV
jgi:hypothetical protein